MQERVKKPLPVTIAEVGERAGVSPTTVSHVLSGNRPVSDATRERVQQAIAELGFRPNGVARSLRMQRTLLVALVIPDITNPFYPVMARGVQDALAPSDYHVVVCNTDGRLDLEQAFLDDVAERRLSGVILRAFHADLSDAGDVLGLGIPIVALGRCFDHPLADCVVTDDAAGARAVVDHLVVQGHRRIGFVGAAGDTGAARESGFRGALAAAGVEIDERSVAHGDWTQGGGAEAMRRIDDRGGAPTALFCANDLMALGAIEHLRETGRSVPGDVAVAGYDDIDAAALVTPALTTVRNPAYEIGKTCAALLLERLGDARVDPAHLTLPPGPLVVRAST